ncbi:cation:dicarboxylase symporter family transporter [Belnapia sp. T18]|uniref:Cation:dicarboxylase symporter family transporter n=1 Tax=Belnapia arida TaxID=2804533 RepID=A0ABS1U119_9PROT|nr:cation:dicarboxylase symporter family transporter [Belnapia arida]
MPRSVFEAMAQDEILQIAVLSLFCGVACAALGERAGTAVAWTKELSQVIPKVAGCSMSFAPLAVFASMAAIITARGLRIP